MEQKALLHFRKNLNHLTLPEIKDFNALSDAPLLQVFREGL